MPRSFREQAEKGFRTLAGLPPTRYAEIINSVISGLESKQAPIDDLQKSLGLSSDDVSSLFSAAMLTIPMLGEGADPAQFLASAVKQGILDDETSAKVKPFIDTVATQRVQIGNSIRRTALPAQVLPFLTDFEVVVDLRMQFNDQTVIDAVPVAMLHVDTNSTGQEIWFQASKQQMVQLRDDVEGAIKQMETAEAWGQREPKP
jgi:hypothetical protein